MLRTSIHQSFLNFPLDLDSDVGYLVHGKKQNKSIIMGPLFKTKEITNVLVGLEHNFKLNDLVVAPQSFLDFLKDSSS